MGSGRNSPPEHVQELRKGIPRPGAIWVWPPAGQLARLTWKKGRGGGSQLSDCGQKPTTFLDEPVGLGSIGDHSWKLWAERGARQKEGQEAGSSKTWGKPKNTDGGTRKGQEGQSRECVCMCV